MKATSSKSIEVDAAPSDKGKEEEKKP